MGTSMFLTSEPRSVWAASYKVRALSHCVNKTHICDFSE